MARDDDFETGSAGTGAGLNQQLALLAGFLNQRRQAPTGQTQFPLIPGIVNALLTRQQVRGATQQQQFENLSRLAQLQNTVQSSQFSQEQEAQRNLLSQAQASGLKFPQTIQAPPGVKVMGQSGRVVKTSPQGVGFIEGKPPVIGALTADQLRADYEAATKPFITVRDAHLRIEATSEGEPSPAGDLALIFSYMRVLDPDSTVREGEFATAQNTAGVPDQIRNLYNKLISGERLNPNQRQDFLRRSRQLFLKAQDQHKQTVNEFKRISSKVGIDPDIVIRDVTVSDQELEEALAEAQRRGLQV